MSRFPSHLPESSPSLLDGLDLALRVFDGVRVDRFATATGAPHAVRARTRVASPSSVMMRRGPRSVQQQSLVETKME